MRRSLFVSLALLAGVSFTSSVFAQTPASRAAMDGRTYEVPRTPWGDPDLQGTYTSDDSLRVPRDRPVELGERRFLTEEEYNERIGQVNERAAAIEVEFEAEGARIGTGPPSHWSEFPNEASRQTSLVIDPPDGRTPPLTPYGESRPRLGEFEPDSPGSHLAFTLYIRCITRGVTGSIWPVVYGNGTRIIQGPGYVGIQNEMVHEARIIPLDDTPYVGDDIRMYMGDSRGHWEGDTLVIETRNLTNMTGVANNGGGNRHSEDMVVTERITRIGTDRVYYEATFDDRRTWTAPWTIGLPLVDTPTYEIFEYACHEGNHGMFNMLSAARAVEAAEETATGQ
jgi:hypothetical protein